MAALRVGALSPRAASVVVDEEIRGRLRMTVRTALHRVVDGQRARAAVVLLISRGLFCRAHARAPISSESDFFGTWPPSESESPGNLVRHGHPTAAAGVSSNGKSRRGAGAADVLGQNIGVGRRRHGRRRWRRRRRGGRQPDALDCLELDERVGRGRDVVHEKSFAPIL